MLETTREIPNRDFYGAFYGLKTEEFKSNLKKLSIEELKLFALRSKLLGFTPANKIQDGFLNSIKRTRAFFGGNKTGKTTCGALFMIYYALGIPRFWPLEMIKVPSYLRIVTTDFNSGVEKIIRPKIEDWLPREEVVRYDKESRTYYLKIGSRIELMSQDQELDKFAGTDRDGTWFDEECDWDIYQECQMRHITTGGFSLLTMTPVKGLSWVYDKIYELDGISPNIECFFTSIFDNPHLKKEEIDMISEGLDEQDKEIRLYGKFIHRSGLVYNEFSRGEPHVINPFIIPDEWIKVAAIDHHIRKPEFISFVALSPDGDAYIYDEVVDKGLIPDVADRLKMREFNIKENLAYTLIDSLSNQPDPITGTSARREYSKHGIHTIPGSKDKDAGISEVKKYLQINKDTGKPRLFVFKTCKQHIHEFTHYVWDEYVIHPENKDQKQEAKDKDCDLLENIRRILLSFRRYESRDIESEWNEEYYNELTQYRQQCASGGGY